MTKLTLKRSENGGIIAEGFDAARNYAFSPEGRGMLSTVTGEGHDLAAQALVREARQIMATSSRNFDEAIEFARALQPGLAFIASCEVVRHERDADFVIREEA